MSATAFVFLSLIFSFKLTRWLLRNLLWLTAIAWRCLAIRARNTHGSARWATWWDLVRGLAWGGSGGIIVGKSLGRFIRFRRDGTTLVYAAAGKGKGVGFVIPNLLDYGGSVVCTDPKGENYAITQRWRSTLGPVYRLNAIDPSASNRLNPFDLIRRATPHEADDCAMLADLLVTPSGVEDTHWDKSARALLAALIQHVLGAYPPVMQTLSTVRELVSADGDAFAEILRAMEQSDQPSVAEAGRDGLASLASPEMLSVKKNAALAMVLWSRDRIGGMLTSASDFDLLDLHRDPMTLYVMVPEDALAVYAPFLRVVMGSALVAMVRGKHLPRPKQKPLLLFDECAALGRLEALEKGLGYLREYAHTLLVFQDLGQIKRRYGDAGMRTFMATAGAQVTFGVSDAETARELAEAIGTATVWSRSTGESTTSVPWQSRRQDGQAEAKRYLVDPAEIRRLSERKAIVFLQGQVGPPILASKVRYYTEWRWRGRFDRWRA